MTRISYWLVTILLDEKRSSENYFPSPSSSFFNIEILKSRKTKCWQIGTTPLRWLFLPCPFRVSFLFYPRVDKQTMSGAAPLRWHAIVHTMFYNRRFSWRKNTHDRQWLTPERRCWTLLHFIPYTLSLSFSLSRRRRFFRILYDRHPHRHPLAPLALFTAKQYTIPSRCISGEHALSCTFASRWGWFRLHSSSFRARWLFQVIESFIIAR